ncbi:hypothetical protein ACFLY9_00450 [Patescibacteria group bacterium]
MENPTEVNQAYSVLMQEYLSDRSILIERFNPKIFQRNLDLISRLYQVLNSFSSYKLLPSDLLEHYTERIKIIATELSSRNPLQMIQEFVTSQQIGISEETPEIITPDTFAQGITGNILSPVWMIPSHETVFSMVKGVMKLSNIDPATVEILTLDRHPDLVSIGDTRPGRSNEDITKATVNRNFLELGLTVSVFGIPPQSYALTVRSAQEGLLPEYFISRSISDSPAVLIMQQLMRTYNERLYIQDPTGYTRKNSRIKRRDFIRTIAQRLESCKERRIEHIVTVVDLDVLDTLSELVSAPEYSIFMELLTLGLTTDSKLESLIETTERSLDTFIRKGSDFQAKKALADLIDHITSHTYSPTHTIQSEEGNLYYPQIFLEPRGLSVKDCCRTLSAIRQICDELDLEFGIPGFAGGICEFEYPDYRNKTRTAMIKISRAMNYES